MLFKTVKYFVFILCIQGPVACASDAPAPTKQKQFVYNEKIVNLVVEKPIEALHLNSPLDEGQATIFDELEINGVEFWVGHHVRNNGHPTSGLFHNKKGKPYKMASGNFGFIRQFNEVYFATINEFDQHESFTTVYMLGASQDGASIWHRRVYVLTGRIVDSFILNDEFIISGTEMGKPFAAALHVDGNSLIANRLKLAK